MDYNTLFTIYKNIPLDEDFDDEKLSKGILSLEQEAHESIAAIILRYFINNPGSDEVRIVDVSESIQHQGGNIQLPYGGKSRGIGTTFSLRNLPSDLLWALKVYVSLISKIA